MNKKFIAVIAALLVAGTSGVFALGIGAQAGYLAGENASGNGSLTFKLDSAPWVFALNVGGIGSNGLSFGLTADMWLANKTFAKPFKYFYGWGLAGSFAGSGDSAYIFLGARAFIGINVFVTDFLELYLQGAWQPGVNLRFNDNGGVGFDVISFPLNLGFRFWL